MIPKPKPNEEPKASITDKIKMDFIKEHFDKLTIDKLQSLLQCHKYGIYL